MKTHSDSSYREAVDYLYALQHHGIKFGLGNSLMLMEKMDNPQRKFRSIHVAGTNGKGSTATFIAAMLRAGGYRVGLYTSPHLVSFVERIRINGKAIAEERVVALVGRVRAAYQGVLSAGEPLNPTFFEVTTAVAFAYFAEEGIDVAVIEVGMGGRLDSTNVITPLVSVITNIDLEHMEYLGNTIELIAAEKAGIIKPGVPVVTGVAQQEAVRVIEREAGVRQSPAYLLGQDFQFDRLRSEPGQVFNFRGIKSSYKELSITMLGSYQVSNACLALAAIEMVGDSGLAVDEDAIRQGLHEAQWEGRLERVGLKPDIYLDGAHNPASARRLAEAVTIMKPAYRRLVLVIGILSDKDIRGIVSELVPLADTVIVTMPEYNRAMNVLALADEVRKIHSNVDTRERVAGAIAKAKEKASPEDMILITGSLYVVGDARAVLVGRPSPADSLAGLKG